MQLLQYQLKSSSYHATQAVLVIILECFAQIHLYNEVL